ncbi:pentapeptide repeat-containing protein [Paenibacillus sp. MBLB4367]|uniref:pentapeptide repeat-containing protein n=1 Tax=Paenibacillus sp. MBLB4367 TaxID=3384767 RepID=UPI0039080E02
MEQERLEIANVWKVIDAKHACFDHSTFVATGAENLLFEDVSLAKTKITNANLSRLEIDGAQLGGAYIHNIGIPKEGDFHYHPETAELPVRFENCELRGSQLLQCDLSDVEISNCELKGMKINGILVEDLLREYKK